MAAITFIAPDLRRLENVSARVLALYRFSDMKPMQGVSSLVDWRLYGHLSRMVINGFFLGEVGESLLMPLGRHLPQEYLLLFGLGSRENFCEKVFCEDTLRTFETVRDLGSRNVVLALPGRVENECHSDDAMEWFLECYQEHGDDQDIQIIEPMGAQKAMVPVMERWRLKQLVP